MGTVRAAFEASARDYDRARRQLVPPFDDFYGAVLESVPYRPGDSFRVLDLGAGTGLLSAMIAEAFPNARLTLVDFSSGMLGEARRRFAPSDTDRFGFTVLDYARETLRGEYEVVVSALSIHHLADEDKRRVFGKVYGILVAGGVFVNADQVLGPTPEIEGRYHEWWLRKAREGGVSEEDLAASLQRIKQDKNATLEAQMAWLGEASFEAVDCPYKNHRFAVYGGRKPREDNPELAGIGKDRTDG